jgi:hypothetical protein
MRMLRITGIFMEISTFCELHNESERGFYADREKGTHKRFKDEKVYGRINELSYKVCL